MAKRIVWTEQARADVRGIERPIPLRILKTLARYIQTGEATQSSFGISSRPSSAFAPRTTESSSGTRATTWKSPACWIARRLTAEHRKTGSVSMSSPRFRHTGHAADRPAVRVEGARFRQAVAHIENGR